MIISDLYNIAFNDITEDYDLFIGVVGDEPRSYYLATKTDLFQKAKNKITNGFKKSNDFYNNNIFSYMAHEFFNKEEVSRANV